MADQKKPVVVLGVSGGIAAYKACEIVSRLKKAGTEVHVIMTENAVKLAAPLTFQTLSGNLVVVDTFTPPVAFEVEHIALAQKADVFVIAPATANILAKMAHGIADDMLSTTVLATKAPVLVAPAMNTAMWEHPATQANVKILQDRGVHMIGPAGGLLACGDSGIGRMSEPEEITEEILHLLNSDDSMRGLRVLVTAGPTREAIDPVRFITNRSSGKMGYAIAETAAARGAEVTLVSGPVSIPAPAHCRVISVETTEDLYQAMMRECAEQDIIIQSAAPADYRPVEQAEQKIKKEKGQPLHLTLVENEDIAAAVGQNKRKGQILVGFAAETENLLDNASGKLHRKNLDMIVANDVTRPGAGFDVDTNIVTLITENHQESFPLMTKKEVSEIILTKAMELYQAGR